jgi:hypothetical protein
MWMVRCRAAAGAASVISCSPWRPRTLARTTTAALPWPPDLPHRGHGHLQAPQGGAGGRRPGLPGPGVVAGLLLTSRARVSVRVAGLHQREWPAQAPPPTCLAREGNVNAMLRNGAESLSPHVYAGISGQWGGVLAPPPRSRVMVVSLVIFSLKLASLRSRSEFQASCFAWAMWFKRSEAKRARVEGCAPVAHGLRSAAARPFCHRQSIKSFSSYSQISLLFTQSCAQRTWRTVEGAKDARVLLMRRPALENRHSDDALVAGIPSSLRATAARGARDGVAVPVVRQ